VGIHIVEHRTTHMYVLIVLMVIAFPTVSV